MQRGVRYDLAGSLEVRRSALRAWGSKQRLAARVTATATGAAFIGVFIARFIGREAMIGNFKREDSGFSGACKHGWRRKRSGGRLQPKRKN
jgi:hypothetical protein